MRGREDFIHFLILAELDLHKFTANSVEAKQGQVWSNNMGEEAAQVLILQ